MFSIQAKEMIHALLESFALASNTPIAIYERGSDGKYTQLVHADREHFPDHCRALWAIKGGESACRDDMTARIVEGLKSTDPSTVMCHAGLTTEIYPIVVDGETVAVLQFGAFLDDRDGEDDLRQQRQNRHDQLMRGLNIADEQAAEINRLLFSEELRRSKEERRLLRAYLAKVVEQVVYRHLKDKERHMLIAFHDVQLQVQAAMGWAAELEDELKPVRELRGAETSLDWFRMAAKNVEAKCKGVSMVLQSLMRGEYLPEDYRFRQQDLRNLITAAISLVHPFAQQKNVVIREEIKPEHLKIMVQASQVHLQQAFNNLVHNAVKYSFRGSKYGDRRVEVRGFYAEHGFKLQISNYGIGILEDEYERVFEEGYKGKLRLEEYRTGSGQGLALTKRIIEKHNGTIAVHSQPVGDPQTDVNCPYLTEFTVWLPLTQPK